VSDETEGKKSTSSGKTVYDSCPHCGRVLSPWEKVLLSVDRMLMCKGCWYRIILDVYSDEKPSDEKKKEEGNT